MFFNRTRTRDLSQTKRTQYHRTIKEVKCRACLFSIRKRELQTHRQTKVTDGMSAAAARPLDPDGTPAAARSAAKLLTERLGPPALLFRAPAAARPPASSRRDASGRPLRGEAPDGTPAVTPSFEHVNYAQRAHGVVVSHPLRMRKALGSIPSVSIFSYS